MWGVKKKMTKWEIDEWMVDEVIKEFFKFVVHVMPPDWDCAELKYEGWNDSTPHLINLLKTLEVKR